MIALISLLLASPATAAELSVIGPLAREAEVEPGEQIGGELQVRNNTDAPLDVLIHQQDYAFHADGRNDFLEPMSLERSNADWVSFSPHQLRIPPGQTVPVAYTIDVPDDAEIDGSYWSLLVIEPMLDLEAPNEGNVRVRNVVRYGIHLVTDVSGEARTELGLVSPVLEPIPEGQRLSIDVVNVGERWLNPQVWAEVFDHAGRRIGRYPAGRARTYPGCSKRVAVDLPALEPGRYTALIVADGGGDDVFGTQLTLDVRAD